MIPFSHVLISQFLGIYQKTNFQELFRSSDAFLLCMNEILQLMKFLTCSFRKLASNLLEGGFTFRSCTIGSQSKDSLQELDLSVNKVKPPHSGCSTTQLTFVKAQRYLPLAKFWTKHLEPEDQFQQFSWNYPFRLL